METPAAPSPETRGIYSGSGINDLIRNLSCEFWTMFFVYLNDEREPLVQVPADGLQNVQLCGGFVQGEILAICDWMTCKKQTGRFRIPDTSEPVSLRRP